MFSFVLNYYGMYNYDCNFLHDGLYLVEYDANDKFVRRIWIPFSFIEKGV